MIVSDGKLWIDAGQGARLELRAESRISFFIDGKASTITFDFDESGRIVRMNAVLAGGLAAVLGEEHDLTKLGWECVVFCDPIMELWRRYAELARTERAPSR